MSDEREWVVPRALAAGVSRRTAIRWLVSGTGVTILAACAPTPPAVKPTAAPAALAPTIPPAPTTAPAATVPTAAAPTARPAATAAPSAQTAAQPRSGGTLRVGRVGDIARLDGHLTTAGETTWMVYDRLTAYDESLKPQPMLAESWDVSSDYKQIQLNLRPGVQFHSGREFTSEDVKWNLLRVRDPKAGAGALTNQSKWFTEIETPTKHSVVLKSDQPRPLVFDMLEFFNILDRESTEGPDPQTKSVGTGAFTFVEWVQGDHLTFAKNKSYWRSGRPYVDEVRVGIYKDATAMVTTLEAGALDLVLNAPPPDFVRLKANPRYQGLTAPALLHVVGINVATPPLDNKKVRQALNYALDRQRFVDTILAGTVEQMSLPWLASSPAYEPAKRNHYAFDLDKSRALLSEAGISGFEVDFLVSPQYPDLYAFSQIYQADLAKLGIALNIKHVEHALWLDQVNNRKYTGLYGSAVNYVSMEPVTVIASSRHFDPAGNNTGFSSEQYTRYLTSASVEPDLAKRKQIYSQLNDFLLDESFAMPVAPSPIRISGRAAVHDLRITQHNAFLYDDAWIDAAGA